MFVHPTAPKSPSHPSAPLKKKKNQISVLNYYLCVSRRRDCATTKSSPHDPKKSKSEAIVIFSFVCVRLICHSPAKIFLKKNTATFDLHPPTIPPKPRSSLIYIYIIFMREHKLILTFCFLAETYVARRNVFIFLFLLVIITFFLSRLKKIPFPPIGVEISGGESCQTSLSLSNPNDSHHPLEKEKQNVCNLLSD